MRDSVLAINLLDAIVYDVTDLFLNKEKGARRSGRPLVTGRIDGYLLVWEVPVASSTAAWAAARRAVSKRKGEQDT
jgi:hypothetical protein